MSRYKIGLNYLKNSDFNIKVKSDFMILNFQKHSYFGEKKENLAIPYQLAGNKLSAEFMKHYDIITKVDLARYLRICAVILTSFQGPNENDHLDFHIFALQQTHGKSTPENEEAIMKAMLEYDKEFGKKKKLPKEDYIAFARILNYFWKIFEPPKGMEPIDPIVDDVDAQWDALIAGDPIAPEGEFDFAQDFDTYVDWVYQEIFRDFNDEKLQKQLNDDIQRNTLMLSLKQCNLGDYTDKQLKDLIKNKKEREILIKKINEWYAQAFPV
jgi:hypothetical protein